MRLQARAEALKKKNQAKTMPVFPDEAEKDVFRRTGLKWNESE